MNTQLEKKLNEIYEFLINNRKYNSFVHLLEYRQALVPFQTDRDKIISLMHYIAGTQSQPNMSSLASFFEDLHIHIRFDTFENFVDSLDDIPNKPGSPSKASIAESYWVKLQRLQHKPGWGPKTAALFCKAMFKLHNEYDEELGIWDVNRNIALRSKDGLKLPVDTVIIRIFEELGLKPATFKSINELLKHKKWDIEVWDDLWFWGFITQRTKGNTRDIVYNPEKLWTLLAIPKDKNTLQAITIKASEFIQLLKGI
ncbi:hypothetical protein SAMN06298216_1684 [Spirosomataceae bacterium TFI 002]|nr:hypothetical protein SAMN06298216_1684 [Spirosomataceae bacterium TFI 002]